MNIAILGGGQLARMLALAGIPLGHKFIFLDPSPTACAASLGERITAEYDNPQALAKVANMADVVSFDFENVPAAVVANLANEVPVYPPPSVLLTAQDRLVEKTFFQKMGAATPVFRPIDSLEQLQLACEEIGLPAVLKTRRMGYDGKGQCLIRNMGQVNQAWQELKGSALILEAFVHFEREISLLAARSQDGNILFYPFIENQHEKGILRRSMMPVEEPAYFKLAREWLCKILRHFEYVGVLTLELFDTGESLLVNEMAPRVHNSGHLTIEGSVCSQFENHIRAISGQALGSTESRGFSCMYNWIGELPDRAECLKIPGLHWHEYEKFPRAGRKIGHATLNFDNRADLENNTARLDILLQERKEGRI